MSDVSAALKAGAERPRETRIERAAKFVATLAAGVLGAIALAYVAAQSLGLRDLATVLDALRPPPAAQAPVARGGLPPAEPQGSPEARRPSPTAEHRAEGSESPRVDRAAPPPMRGPAPLGRGELAGLRAVLLPDNPSARSQDTWPVAALEARLRQLGVIVVASPAEADISLDIRFVAANAGIAPPAAGDTAYQRREAGTLAVRCRHAQGRPCPSFDRRLELVGHDQGQLQRHAVDELVTAWFEDFAR